MKTLIIEIKYQYWRFFLWGREQRLRLLGVNRDFYCQRCIEGASKCRDQCTHCKEYYKPLETSHIRTVNCLKCGHPFEMERDFCGTIICENCDSHMNGEFPKFAFPEMFSFVEWVNDNGFQKYAEGWCKSGGSNGWHCTTRELYEVFRLDIKK